MLIYEGSLHKKIGAIYQLGAEKITLPPKPDGHTDRQTDGRTFYRVALLLKKLLIKLKIPKAFIFICYVYTLDYT